jgi:hypothetical protein
VAGCPNRLPTVVASGTGPLILVTRRVRGSSLFSVPAPSTATRPGGTWPGSWVDDLAARFRLLGWP